MDSPGVTSRARWLTEGLRVCHNLDHHPARFNYLLRARGLAFASLFGRRPLPEGEAFRPLLDFLCKAQPRELSSTGGMMKRVFVCLAFFGLSILSCTFVWAQATAEVSGTVKDQTGAVLPGVEVTVTHVDTSVARSTVTNETGSYVLPNLPVGPYKLEASLPGFRSYVQSGIVLQVGSSPVVNPTMEVGQVTEQIEVQANAALVETRSSGIGQVMENQRLLDLPLNGRNIIELVTLSGAATASTGGGVRDPLNRTAVSIAGGLRFGVAYSLDGAPHKNPWTNLALSVPFPDALQEFKVETSATSAQNGMHSAGAVTLVTKSGTNEFHGNLFEFVRNGRFNARNVFSLRNDSVKRNQFGGTIGGPIRHNKLFFFAGYQGMTSREDPSDLQNFVPNDAMMRGDFTVFASAQCQAGRNITLRAPFVNNRIDPALFSPAALNLMARSDWPKTTDPCGRVVYGNRSAENQHSAVGKIDYQMSSNHSIFGRYLVDHLTQAMAYDFNHN